MIQIVSITKYHFAVNVTVVRIDENRPPEFRLAAFPAIAVTLTDADDVVGVYSGLGGYRDHQGGWSYSLYETRNTGIFATGRHDGERLYLSDDDHRQLGLATFMVASQIFGVAIRVCAESWPATRRIVTDLETSEVLQDSDWVV